MMCRTAMCLIAATLLTLAAPAVAEPCKYVDRDRNMHYTNVAPEKGWKLVECGVGCGAGVPDYPRQIARDIAKVRVGMTIARLGLSIRILVKVPDRTELAEVPRDAI